MDGVDYIPSLVRVCVCKYTKNGRVGKATGCMYSSVLYTFGESIDGAGMKWVVV